MAVVRTKRERKFIPHRLLLRGAKHFLETAGEKKDGWYYDSGMSVSCPNCGRSLTIPPAADVEPELVDATAGKSEFRGGFGEIIQSAIHEAAKNIEAGVLDDDQKLDNHLKNTSPEVLSALYGKEKTRAFLDGKISGRDLMESGFKLSPKAVARLRAQMETIPKKH